MEHTMSKEEVRQKMKGNFERGLKEDEAKARQEVFGKNVFSSQKKESLFVKFIKQFNDFMIIILIAAAVVSTVLAKLDGTGDYVEPIIIIVIVILNAIMGLVQESKAEKSLEALKKMSAPVTKVVRDGSPKVIAGEDVVPGDIVILEAGNYVPADLRLIQDFNLKVDESALTGEAVPVTKDSNCELEADTADADMKNMAFATTIVTSGHAKGIVVRTGMETKVGGIAKAITEETNEQTPIQRKLEEVR